MGRDGGTATRLDGTVGGRGERGLEVVSHTRTSPSSKTVGEEVCFRRWGAPPPAPPAHSSASCPPEAVLLTPLPTPTSRQAPAQLQPSGHSPGPSPRPHPCELCSGAPDTVAAPAHTAAQQPADKSRAGDNRMQAGQSQLAPRAPPQPELPDSLQFPLRRLGELHL